MYRAPLQRNTALLWRCMALLRKYRDLVDIHTAFCGDIGLICGYIGLVFLRGRIILKKQIRLCGYTECYGDM